MKRLYPTCPWRKCSWVNPDPRTNKQFIEHVVTEHTIKKRS